jgi:hypothetical protein
MASTYEPIATTTLGSNQNSVTFSSISSTYTDLVLVANCRLAAAGFAALLQFNTDAGTNYSITELYGDGSAARSGRNENISGAYLTNNIAVGDATSKYNPFIINIMNYSNTTTYKTILSRFSNANTGVDAIVNLWRSTNAINEIKMGLTGSGGNYASGSTFSLYGIKAA